MIVLRDQTKPLSSVSLYSPASPEGKPEFVGFTPGLPVFKPSPWGKVEAPQGRNGKRVSITKASLCGWPHDSAQRSDKTTLFSLAALAGFPQGEA